MIKKHKHWEIDGIRCSAYHRQPDMSGACFEAAVSYYKDHKQWHISELASSMEDAIEKADNLAIELHKFLKSNG